MVVAVDRFHTTTAAYGDGMVTLGAGDFRVLLAHGNLLFKAPARGREAMRDAIDRDAALVSEAFALKHGVDVGDRVELIAASRRVSFLVAAVYYDYTSDSGQVVMDVRTFARHFGDWSPTGLTVYLREQADPEQVRAELFAALPPNARVAIHTNRSLRQEVLRIFDSTFTITYALEVVAIVVAILGVAATLLTLTLERRRELAVLRLIGADRRQIRWMVVLEAVLIGGVSQVVGVIVGFLLALVLIFVINLQSFGWTIQFHVPAVFLAQVSLLILVSTALAGLYPGRLAADVAIAREVAEE
jgi:putative ABC transport system permease protein